MEAVGLWYISAGLDGIAFSSNSWSLEPATIKKWRWNFGETNDDYRHYSCSHATEEKAEEYRVGWGLNWKERIDHTEKEFPEESK